MKNTFMAISLLVITMMASTASLLCMEDEYSMDYNNCCADSVGMEYNDSDESCTDGSCEYDIVVD